MLAKGLISDASYVIKSREPAIGEGSLSVIYHAEQVRNGTVINDLKLAAKIFKGATFTPELKKIFQHQYKDFRVRSRYIVEVFDWCVVPKNGMPHIKDHMVIMEFVEGVPLNSYIDSNDLSLLSKIKLMRQLLEAVSEFQRFNWIHRDLKPTNILIASSGNIKIIDLDLAVNESLDVKWNYFQGTYEYSAPEVLDSLHYSKSSDNWAVGILLYYIFYGRHPIQRDLPVKSMDEIKKVSSYYEARFYFDPAFQKVNEAIKKMLAKEPRQRINILNQVLGEIIRIEKGAVSVFSKWYWNSRKVKVEYILMGAVVFLILVSVILNELLR